MATAPAIRIDSTGQKRRFDRAPTPDRRGARADRRGRQRPGRAASGVRAMMGPGPGDGSVNWRWGNIHISNQEESKRIRIINNQRYRQGASFALLSYSSTGALLPVSSFVYPPVINIQVAPRCDV